MPFSGMICRLALVRTDVSEDLTSATRRNIPEDGIFLIPEIFHFISRHAAVDSNLLERGDGLSAVDKALQGNTTLSIMLRDWLHTSALINVDIQEEEEKEECQNVF
jgi:hypothetical protein